MNMPDPMKKRRCSSCGEWKRNENFYGKTKKQSRCIPCYNAAYGAYYRQSLRESRYNTEVKQK